MPVDRGSIDEQLRSIGEGERWWEQREFRDLPHILHTSERICGLVTGELLGDRGPRLRARPWLIVVTNQRLICVRQERFARSQVDFAAEQIVRIDQSSGLRSHQITVETPERRCRIRIPKRDASRFANALSLLVPRRPIPHLHPDLEPLSWLPGITTIATLPGVAGILAKVSTLSPPDYGTQSEFARLEATVERLQSDVDRLQQHVSFLEDLLQKRAEEAAQSALPLDL